MWYCTVVCLLWVFSACVFLFISFLRSFLRGSKTLSARLVYVNDGKVPDWSRVSSSRGKLQLKVDDPNRIDSETRELKWITTLRWNCNPGPGHRELCNLHQSTSRQKGMRGILGFTQLAHPDVDVAATEGATLSDMF